MRISDWSSDVCSSDLLEHEYPLIPLKDWVEAHDRRLSGMCGQRTMDVHDKLDWGARDNGAHIAGRCVELEWFAAGQFLAKIELFCKREQVAFTSFADIFSTQRTLECHAVITSVRGRADSSAKRWVG